MKKAKKKPVIRVCGIEYDLVFVDGLGIDHEDTLGGIVDANVDRPKIVIDAKQPLSVQRETLLHELVHAADRVSCGGKQLPEKTIDRLSRIMYSIGRDNLSSMIWIFGSGDD